MASTTLTVKRPWVGRYVSEWRNVSDNAGAIRDMVRELPAAYAIGLDITSETVIGRMFYLAVQVWSTVGHLLGSQFRPEE